MSRGPLPTAETRLYAVLGDPVRHSLSPQIQTAAFRAAGIDAVYVALEVPRDALSAALEGLRAAGVQGLNLTTPLKEAAWPLIARATDEAQRISAVNTLRLEQDGWSGHATDGLGFADWMRALGVTVRGARVLVLGAGGAVRSIAPVLLEASRIGIVSRDLARARVLSRWLGDGLGFSGERIAAGLEEAPAEGGPWDLLLRALTSEEVSAAESAWWEGLDAGALALELNYTDRAASARARASLAGVRFESGEGLLVHQGARSFEFWTSRSAPIQAMWAALHEEARSGRTG